MITLEGKVIRMTAIAGVLFLAGCGSSGDGPAGDNMGTFNLSVSDSPIRDATKVCIKFDGVELNPADDGDAIDINFDDPVVVNLLANQGAVSESLVSAEVETYQWIRRKVDAVSRLYAQDAENKSQKTEECPGSGGCESKKYKLFSQEQIDALSRAIVVRP